jgi:hypothetical protein
MPEEFQMILSAFQPLIGRLAWSVCRVHGSILTMEFGEPHVRVRGPIVASADASERVRRNLARRRVFLCGEWRLAISYAFWEITTRYVTVNSDEFDIGELQDTLNEVDGQRLLSVEEGAEPGSFVLIFDLGASILIRPNASDEDDQWTIYDQTETSKTEAGAGGIANQTSGGVDV